MVGVFVQKDYVQKRLMVRSRILLEISSLVLSVYRFIRNSALQKGHLASLCWMSYHLLEAALFTKWQIQIGSVNVE